MSEPATPARVLVVGASGTFGRLLATELLERTDARVVLAARNPERVAEIAETFPGRERTEIRRVDLHDIERTLAACEDCLAVACAAGPFQSLDPSLPGRVAAEGIHWVDLSDYDDWVLALLADEALSARAAQHEATIVPGASVSPALTGVLARRVLRALPAASRVRLTLFIGNHNIKGQGAVDSALASGFSDPVEVDLPGGTRHAYRFASPDARLLKAELGVPAEFRVCFELPVANWVIAGVQPISRHLGARARARLARTLRAGSRLVSGAGSDAGIVQAEAFDEGGTRAYAALVGTGQRIAMLPAFVVLEDLLAGGGDLGCVSPATWIEPDAWITRLNRLGLELVEGGGHV